MGDRIAWKVGEVARFQFRELMLDRRMLFRIIGGS